MSDKVVNPRSPPSQDSPERQVKKRRKALSCNECRRRKLKCDRTYPCCARCQKSGDAEHCVYETTPREAGKSLDQTSPLATNNHHDNHLQLNSTSINGIVNDVDHHHHGPHHHHPHIRGREDIDDEVFFRRRRERARQVHMLESRIADLEGMLGRQTDLPRQHLMRQKGDTKSDETYFRGKGFRTQYYGPSNSSGVFPRFGELKEFMKETSDDPSLRRMKQDFREMLKMADQISNANIMVGNDTDLFRLLPDKQTTDRIIQVYMDTLETVYCILHKPSFWTEYSEFWSEPQDGEERRPGFAALLLVILAAANCAAAQEPFAMIGDQSLARQQASSWIEASEAWLDRHSQKHLTVTVFQVHCLLLIAKTVNSIKVKRLWTLTGTTLRFSMSVGLHLDPSRLGGRISVFNQEMRRRLWATMMELELQASVNRGMTSCLDALQLDCAVPANMHDTELKEAVDPLPTSRESKEFTDTSFLHVARQSLPLRIRLTSLVNNPASRLTVDEVLRYEEQIMEHLSSIPAWSDSDAMTEKTLFARTVLDIQLRQFLILLHTPLCQRDQSQTRTDYSRMVCFNSACKILDLHYQLVVKSNSVLSLYTSDVLRVASSLCHNILISSTSPSVLLASACSSAGDHVEKALMILEDKALRLGSGFLQCWMIICAHAFAQPGVSTDKEIRQKEQRSAVDRGIKVFGKMITLLTKSYGSNEPTSVESTVEDSPLIAQTGMNDMMLVNEDFSVNQNGIGMDLGFDMSDLSGWMFNNDWAFAPSWMPNTLDK